MKEKLVLFDFDGTLTKRDSMLEFTRYYCGTGRYVLGMLYLLPILLSYKAGWMPNWRAKEHFLTHFFGKEPASKFQSIADRFALERIPALLRPTALRQLEEYRMAGERIAIVSSSAEDWLSAWCRQTEVHLIATRLETENGRITGKLKGRNCYGLEKANRVKEVFPLADFSEIIVYGDSKGDFELFGIATSYFYKPFRKETK